MSNFPEFRGFSKISRLSRDIIISEKIDGTNGLIYLDNHCNISVGSKNKWLDDHNDNHGFWHWVMENKEELRLLGSGYHYGEWWGKGIQRGYGLKEKRFSLFNVARWTNNLYLPKCCYIVPILYEGMFNTSIISSILDELKITGSKASEGFMQPEGIIIYHKQGNVYFKKTIENDEKGKEG